MIVDEQSSSAADSAAVIADPATSRWARRVTSTDVASGVVGAASGLVAYYLYERSSSYPIADSTSLVPLTSFRTTVGYNFDGDSAAKVRYILHNFHLPAVPRVTAPVDPGTNWAIVAFVVLGALILVVGEARARRRNAKRSKFLPFALTAVAAAGMAVVMEIVQLRNIPLLVQFTSPPPYLVHTTYGTAMVVLGGALILQVVGLGLLGGRLAWLSSRRGAAATLGASIRSTRLLWVTVAMTTLLTAAVTQLWR